MASREVHACETLPDLWAALAAAWRESAAAAVLARGFFTAAISGGRTPGGFYRLLQQVPGLPWRRTHLFLADERLVPPESPESNARLIRETLLDGLATPPAGTHFVRTVFPNEAAAAGAYRQELVLAFAALGESVPRFDLVLLGIGEDGHTASLFPGSGALAEQVEPVAGVPAADGRRARVTLTLPIINAARRVIFLAAGPGKRAVLGRVLAGDRELPAARVDPAAGTVAYFVDREAFPGTGPTRPAT